MAQSHNVTRMMRMCQEKLLEFSPAQIDSIQYLRSTSTAKLGTYVTLFAEDINRLQTSTKNKKMRAKRFILKLHERCEEPLVILNMLANSVEGFGTTLEAEVDTFLSTLNTWWANQHQPQILITFAHEQYRQNFDSILGPRGEAQGSRASGRRVGGEQMIKFLRDNISDYGMLELAREPDSDAIIRMTVGSTAEPNVTIRLHPSVARRYTQQYARDA